MAEKPDGNAKAKVPAYASSMAQAASLMGVHKSVLKAAKGAGCPGFIGSRVYMDEVKFWLDTQAAKQPQVELAGSKPTTRDLRDEVADLNAMLAQVDALAKEAMSNGAVPTALDLLGQRKSLSDQRNAAMVQMRRQGKTEDDSVPRPEVERMCRALAYNAALGLQRAAVEIVNKLDGITDPTLQHPIVTSCLIADVYLAPFEQALNLAAGHGLPSWAVEAMRRNVDDMTEEAP